MDRKWYYLNDGYGIVGWGFECVNCGTENTFCSIDDEIICEQCGYLNEFSEEEQEEIDKSL